MTYLKNFLKKKLWFFYPLVKKIFEKFLYGRVIFLQGYLHSDLSSLANIQIGNYKNINNSTVRLKNNNTYILMKRKTIIFKIYGKTDIK